MEDAQVLALLRDFLERKHLVKTAATLSQELLALESAPNGLQKTFPGTAIVTHTGLPSHMGLIQDGSSSKLDVLAEVEDEDFRSSSPATNSPQCIATEIITAGHISVAGQLPASTAIPISKMVGKTEGAEKLPQYPVLPVALRRANSYQPQSMLESVMVEGKKSNATPDVYVRPKRVSTSTGHQRPPIESDDFLLHVPLSMQESGFIPFVRDEDGTIKRSSPSSTTTSSAPIPSSLHQIQQQQLTGGISTSKKNKNSADGARSGSGGTERSRSRTSSVSEETRLQNVVLIHPTNETLQDELQALMVSPQCASPPQQGNDVLSLSTLTRASAGAPGSAPKFSQDLAFQDSAAPHTPLSIGPATDVVFTNAPANPSAFDPAIPNTSSSYLQANTSTTSSSENASSAGHSDHPTVESSYYETSSTSSSNKNRQEVNSNTSASEKDVFRPVNGLAASSAPASSTMRTITVSTFSKSGATIPAHSETAPKSQPGQNPGPGSQFTTEQGNASQTSSMIDAPLAGTATMAATSAHVATNNTVATGAFATGVSTNNGTNISNAGTDVNSAIGSPRSRSLSANTLNETDTESITSDIDEYSDDDDLGYIRVGANTMSSRHLVQHLSVWAMDDSSDDSDSSLSSDDTDSSDSDEDSSDDDIGVRQKGSTKAHLKTKKKSGSSSNLPSSAMAKSKNSNEGASGGNNSSAADGGRTLFHMEDISSPPAGKQAEPKRPVHQPSKWLSRALPTEGPTPYLKLPSNVTHPPGPSGPPSPLPNSSAALAASSIAQPSDFSIVNVKRTRQERELQLEYFNMKIIYDRQKTGFEATHDFPIRISDVIAGRYEIVEYLGSAAFSRAVKCIDHLKGTTVCLKIIKNNKDYFDQSLDEIKLLTLIRTACNGRCDDFHVLEIYDFFYFKEHLFLVCELLRENLYEVYKYNRQSGETIYFNIPRLQRVAWQCLIALNFIHRKNLIHCDLKPENVLIKSYSRSLIKSRSYRAPEVVLGYPYDQRIDMWSLGCILAELWTGRVLFQNESLATLIAKHIGIIGLEKSDREYLKEAPLADDIFTTEGVVYEKKAAAAGSTSSSSTTEFIQIKKTSLRKRIQTTDPLFLSFVSSLLRINPAERPTSWEAMHHPWFRQVYPDP